MGKNRAYWLVCLLVSSTVGTVHAQGISDLLDFGPPDVRVTLEHPPQLGLDVEAVAFAQAEGECADEYVDALMANFIANGVQVTDRAHLESILAEHEFSLSGVVDREDAVELGRILGATALIFVKARRCAADRQSLTNHQKTITGKVSYEFISRTTAHFKATVQIVDLSTARIHSAIPIDISHPRQNSSSTGQPPHPSTYDTIDEAIQRAVLRVHQMFFPWNEHRTLPFYEDKNCNLKLAYNLVVSGDIEGAVTQSQANVRTCEAEAPNKQKLLAKAYYNLGTAYCLADEFELGLDYLNQALRLRPNETTSRSLSSCRHSQEVAEQMKAFLEEGLPASGQVALGGTEEASEDTRPVGERLDELTQLFEQGLITEDLYKKKVSAAVSEAGAPGTTTEEQLRNLKDLVEKGLITTEVYEKKVSEVLANL